MVCSGRWLGGDSSGRNEDGWEKARRRLQMIGKSMVEDIPSD